MKNRFYPCQASVALVILAGTTAAFAQKKPHRHHGAHEHGAANLNVALEGNELRLSLNMPMDNVVGFEHPPRNSQEKAHLDKAMADLKDGAKVATFPAAAKCALAIADVKSDFEDHDDEDHGHDHADAAKPVAKADAKGATAKKEGHGHAEHEHAEVNANYTFKCEAVGQLKSFDLALFKTFAPRLAKAAVSIVTASKQGSASLTKDSPTVTLP